MTASGLRRGRGRVHRGEPGGLRVDWPLCQGRGLCAQVVPELVRLDEWGYPIVTGPVDAEVFDRARDAVRMCPHLALRLVEG